MASSGGVAVVVRCAGGDVAFPRLGAAAVGGCLRADDPTPSIAKGYGYAASRGALIDTIAPGSPAAHVGLRAGRDAIVRPVATPDETIRVTVVRGHARSVVPVVPAARTAG